MGPFARGFRILRYPWEVPEEVITQWLERVTRAKPSRAAPAYHVYARTFPGTTNLSGACGEIGRCFFPRHRPPLTPEDVALQFGDPRLAYSLRTAAEWLEDLKPARNTGYDPMDLLYWEQRCGNWAANSVAELDVVIENCMIFNNRKLLKLLLGVSPEQRRKEYSRFFHQLIRFMQPRLADIPFPTEFTDLLKNFLRRIQLYEFVKKMNYSYLQRCCNADSGKSPNPST